MNRSATDDSIPSGLRYRRWLHALAMLLVLGTFILVAIGGTVTSYDAGMAVPDGFTTFGYWSLTAPLEVWWHDFGTRLEHSHRLKGYVVGWLTIGVLVGVMLTQRGRGSVKWLAWGLLVFVIAQGVLGILRVDEVSFLLAAVHGVTGQMFLCLTVLMAAMVGRQWIDTEKSQTLRSADSAQRRRVPVPAWVLLGLLLVQLTLGAAVRHSHSALSIPDWPLHYGGVVPPMSQEAIDSAVTDEKATLSADSRFAPSGGYAAWQVHLHFTHRVMAYGIFIFCGWFFGWCEKRYKGDKAVLMPVRLLGVLLLLQVALGVMTVWSGEHATFATLHQTTGAAMIACATWVAIRLKLAGTRELAGAREFAGACEPGRAGPADARAEAARSMHHADRAETARLTGVSPVARVERGASS